MSIMQFSFYECTDIGKARQANEDNLGSISLGKGYLWVVCDGMGGHQGGATASGIAVKSILEFARGSDFSTPEQDLKKAISFANEQIYATALNDPNLKGMGTTVVVLLLLNDEIWIAHVGDSRAYILSEGKLYRISRDHSFVQGLVDQGLLTEEQAENHPRKNELLKALGIRAETEAEVVSRPLLSRSGDLFLLCSDGLNGMINHQQIHNILLQEGSLEDQGQALLAAANQAGGYDNITATLVRVEDSPHKSSRFDPILPPKDLAHTQPSIVEDPSPEDPRSPGGGLQLLQDRWWVVAAGLGLLLIVMFVFSPFSSEGGVLGNSPDSINAHPNIGLEDSKGEPLLDDDSEKNDTTKNDKKEDNLDSLKETINGKPTKPPAEKESPPK